MMIEPVVIACDESGAEGENVTAAGHRLFVHGSVDLTVAEAQAVMTEVRRLAPSQAPEYKADQVLRPAAAGAVEWLLSSGGPLTGQARVYLVDKDYFVVGKVVDLLLEEVTHAAGLDLYADGTARTVAFVLHRKGPAALPGAQWQALLAAFNSLMRARQRQGAKTTVEEFFDIVDQAAERSSDLGVTEILGLLARGRPHARAFRDLLVDQPDVWPSLDPLAAALAATVRAWAAEKNRPVMVVHDRQAAITPPRIRVLAEVLADPGEEFRHLAPSVVLVGVDQADSKDDPRVQVADLLAGTARDIASSALAGRDDPRIGLLVPFVDGDSLWSDDASWTALTGRTGVGL